MIASMPALMASAQDNGVVGSSKATDPPLRNRQYNYRNRHFREHHMRTVLTAPELPPITPTTFAMATSASRGLSHAICGIAS